MGKHGFMEKVKIRGRGGEGALREPSTFLLLKKLHCTFRMNLQETQETSLLTGKQADSVMLALTLLEQTKIF